MKCLKFHLDWGSDAKYKDNRKKIRSVSGKNFCDFENLKTRLKIETPSFFNLVVSLKSTYVISGKLGRIQARISRENWVWITTWTYWKQCWNFKPVRILKQKSSLKNHCGFATNVSQKSGKIGLLQFDCNLGFSWVRHILLLLICIQNWNTPDFFAASPSILFLIANITTKRYQEDK